MMNHNSDYATPVPMLQGKVVFYIAPHTPMVDINAYRISNAIKAGSSIYLNAQPDERVALDKWIDELPVLLELTPRIEFLYGDDPIPPPVQAFKAWWEQTVQSGVSAITVFDQRCEHVSGILMTTWNAAYSRGQMPLVQPASKPGDKLTPAEREAAEQSDSPLV